ncbi:dicarboxylate/amino acid:cation symporter [Enterococcus saccharolyticus]|uniref:Sodium:dicarboxylate symporter n=1 Tax=Candidatus Enterococcus willemsii TaxID=1857215 RepID=A0ABQ6YXF4_9ENTE|nr:MULTISPECIES: dicarboxylate/amino acid:cation symporter [Enterococcus]KAF1302575.1 sodium:dicarboxylate symporter [Enterococcus sp. CU12B]MCD5003038.1 dicarboxylate/amino acid:cation symporter [Enterococcus saccharolyticus]
MNVFKWVAKSTTTQMVIALVGGMLFGTVVGEWAGNLKFIGDIFIRLIQMSIVVLVMTSVISAIGEMARQKEDTTFGIKMGVNTFKWIITFTVIAAALGYFLAVVIQPGKGMMASETLAVEAPESMGFQETLTNFVSTNIFEAMATANMIPIIVFSVLFGAGLNMFVKKTGQTIVLDGIKEIHTIVLNVIQLVMKVAPIGVFCLLADVAGSTGIQIIFPMIKYLGILLIGVLVMMIVMASVVAIRCKINPMLLPKKFVDMSIVALTTTSSAITFPTALKDCIEKFGVRRDVANFTMSVGMTMGSAGAAMCYVVMIIFMQQSSGVELSFLNLLIGIGLSIMLTLGTITVPGSAAVVATFLGTSLGLPLDSIALLIGVDWFAGMFRTFLNVNNDVFISMLVAESVDALDKEVYNNQKIVHAE